MKLKLIGGRRIESPKSILTRPTSLIVREALFNILGNNVNNSNWLDLFSGSGAISCEAYNHGARKIVAIEKNRKNAQICFNNLLSLENAVNRKNDFEVICKDVISWTKASNNKLNFSRVIELNKNKFDFIYIDPPYKAEYYHLIINQIFESKFIKSGTTVICENSKSTEIKENKIYNIKDIRIYGQTKLTFLVKV
tara:strand:- start:19000 stop:19584 length:585 start_codon:yes stop_codon:yes gene_type:complete